MRSLADQRASLDSRLLKKTIKDFYALLSASRAGEELQAAHSTFLVGLDQLAQHLGRAEKVEQVTQWEVDEYRQEASSLEQQSTDTRLRLHVLEEKLDSAKKERARRIEYDGLARGIGKVPDRSKGQETIARLTSDIASLTSESAEYASTWRLRKDAFGDIVGRLQGMQEAIRDEKAEQARRLALDADADADEEPGSAEMSANPSSTGALDPNAKEFVPGASGTASGSATPAPTAAGEDVEMGGAETPRGEKGDGEVEGGQTLERSTTEEGLVKEGQDEKMEDEREEGEEGEL
ncbi:hypothetical protein JCM8547_004766 [Rhodosporidiobolus lusitaniae]